MMTSMTHNLKSSYSNYVMCLEGYWQSSQWPYEPYSPRQKEKQHYQTYCVDIIVNHTIVHMQLKIYQEYMPR